VQNLRQQALSARKRSPVGMYRKQCVGATGKCVLSPTNAKDQQARTNEPRSGWTVLRALLHPFVMRIIEDELMEFKNTFEVVVRNVAEFDVHGEYPTVEATEARSVASTRSDEKFSEVYAGGLIATVVKFLDKNGVDALSSLCYAIEQLGADDGTGNATVFMDLLYDPACQQVRKWTESA